MTDEKEFLTAENAEIAEIAESCGARSRAERAINGAAAWCSRCIDTAARHLSAISALSAVDRSSLPPGTPVTA